MIKKLFPKSEFVKNITTIFIGNVVAQLIPLLALPFLSRFFEPKDFGDLAIYVSIFTLFSVIATLRYELAIVLPKKDSLAFNILILSIIITIIVTLLSLIIVCIFNKQICTLYNSSSVSLCLYLIPVSVFLTAIYQILNYWANRNKRFKRIAIGRIYQTSFTAGVNLLFGWKKFFSGGLIIGSICGQLVLVLFMLIKSWNEFKKRFKMISFKRMIEQAILYKDFPLINTFHSFFDKFKESSVIFLISYFFTTDILGYYSFATKLVFVPLGLISLSISQVFFQKASQIYSNHGNIQILIKKIILKLIIILLPVFILSVLFSPTFFAVAFGYEWREAGVYVQILSPFFFLRFLGSIFAVVPMIVNKQKQMFFMAFVGNMLFIVAIFIGGYYYNDIRVSLIMVTVLESIYFILNIFWLYLIAK